MSNSKNLKVDVCVIGAGSGGLSVAAVASQVGASTVLVEKHKMGGDCLNYGCVPSKSLLAAAHAAHVARHSAQLGVTSAPTVDFAAVHRHVHGVIGNIAPHDSVERFTGLGVQVIQGAGCFTSPTTVQVGDTTITARKFVVATGSSAFIPPIPGLDTVPYLTNETIFDLTTCPTHLVVIGGGPIGVEMAQAHRRLGARVTIIEGSRFMAKDDPELTAVVQRHLVAEGIEFVSGCKTTKVEKSPSGEITVTGDISGQIVTISCSHLLVAAGRRANVNGLGLEAAGVKYSPRGIEVDARLRSTNKRIFAIGDVAGPYQFTHMAGYQAGIAIRNILFGIPARVAYHAVPWVTYTDPELAHVGLSEADAKKTYSEKDLKIIRWSLEENDRAQAERKTDGFIKVIATRKGKILGVSLVGPHAGEIIQPWILAISQGLNISAMTSYIAPYPTLGEVNKRAAGQFFVDKLYGPASRFLVSIMKHLP